MRPLSFAHGAAKAAKGKEQTKVGPNGQTQEDDMELIPWQIMQWISWHSQLSTHDPQLNLSAQAVVIVRFACLCVAKGYADFLYSVTYFEI